MSLCRPEGVQVEIGGEAHSLLFTLRAVCEIEEHYDTPIGEVIRRLTDEKTVYATLTYLLTVLVNDDLYSHDRSAAPYTEDEIGGCISIHESAALGRAVMTAYVGASPKQDEDGSPNQTRSRRKSISPGSSTSGQTSSVSQRTRSGV